MEKDPQPPESMATVTIKAEYPPSEVYSSEPPPAYQRPQSSAVQVAKIIAVTVVLVSIVLGSFLLASSYVTANASCKQLEQELQLLSETADRFAPPLLPEALIQEEPKSTAVDPAPTEEHKNKEVHDNSISQDSDGDNSEENSNETEEDDKLPPIHIKLPLQLNMDDLAGAIVDKNQRSKMNCIVEKKRAEEVVDHQPKTVKLFGVNLTTDPRYEHVTGERMIILCESGSLQSHTPPEPESEEQEETVMIQPIVIPIGPINPFQTHMAQQANQLPQHMQPPQMQMPHPMETLRPPMPGPMMQQGGQGPPMPPPFIQHIAQQLINQRLRMEALRAQEEAAQRAQAEAAQRSEQEDTQVINDVAQPDSEQRPPPRFPVHEMMMAQRIAIPEEVLSQINRLPNPEVILSVSEEQEQEPQEMRIIQQQRQSAQEMNGRQTYARGLPVHIPVSMMQQEIQEPQPAASEAIRPHYVQPRSVRSVDALLPKTEKRVKRCSCDCAC